MQDDVTELLVKWRAGDKGARDALMDVVYQELKRLAAREMAGERQDHTLGATGLVHEAWLRMSQGKIVAAESRRHFQVLAARVMRQVLVDHGRRRAAAKRGGQAQRVTLDVEGLAEGESRVDAVAVADALAELEAQEGREYAEVVELRFFAGMTVSEIAEHQGVGSATVDRRWRLAKARLYRMLASR